MPDLDLAAAGKMTDAAFEYAAQNGWRVSVVVLDAGGHPVRVSRMDGCNFLSPDIARGKAYGAVAWKVPSVDLANRFQANAAASAGMVGISGLRIVPVQGAVPIWDAGRCIGAIGVSGARSDQDEEAARAGIKAAGFTDQGPG